VIFVFLSLISSSYIDELFQKYLAGKKNNKNKQSSRTYLIARPLLLLLLLLLLQQNTITPYEK